MKAIILTDDTKSQLPKHRSWSKKFGRGSGIAKDPSINNLLIKENLPIPTNDLENEEKYQQILSEFARPAKNMFAGRFFEIRSFEEKLKKLIGVESTNCTRNLGLNGAAIMSLAAAFRDSNGHITDGFKDKASLYIAESDNTQPSQNDPIFQQYISCLESAAAE